jgi:hypothetical protein
MHDVEAIGSLHWPRCGGKSFRGERIENIPVFIPGITFKSRTVSGHSSQFFLFLWPDE